MNSTDDIFEYKLIRGDVKAFECLFKLYYAKLTLFANRFLNDIKASEEIVSDVFTALWEKGHDINFTGSVKSYLYKSVQNKSLNYLKHKKIESFYVDYLQRNHLLNELFCTTESRIQENEMTQQINTAIATLPSKCREVFVMSRYDHLKYNEIALKLNISQKTVERHMGMALEKLRRLLKNVTYEH